MDKAGVNAKADIGSLNGVCGNKSIVMPDPNRAYRPRGMRGIGPTVLKRGSEMQRKSSLSPFFPPDTEVGQFIDLRVRETQ